MRRRASSKVRTLIRLSPHVNQLFRNVGWPPVGNVRLKNGARYRGGRLVPTVHIQGRVLGTQAVTDAVKGFSDMGPWGGGPCSGSLCSKKGGPRKIFGKWKKDFSPSNGSL